ncbi:hypothetical protein HMPREF3233_01640 [Veillonella atypica]|jgi:hypothetical protein|uniref:Uncharacterized protein n=1 Tax=Veillonella atypica TaxID=39777 RepID=A0A133S230_9FIRM|nr:hypothetical protein HMPREF3233_01640 [Veillonella atypica]
MLQMKWKKKFLTQLIVLANLFPQNKKEPLSTIEYLGALALHRIGANVLGVS